MASEINGCYFYQITIGITCSHFGAQRGGHLYRINSLKFDIVLLKKSPYICTAIRPGSCLRVLFSAGHSLVVYRDVKS